MASNICGWCGKSTHLTPKFAQSMEMPLEQKNPVTQVVYRCDHCAWLSIAWAPGSSGNTADTGVNDRHLTKKENVKWLPRKGDTVSYEDVPPIIAGAAAEAHECASIGAKQAAILMARSVIEASAKEKGVAKGTLYDKIDALAANGIIRPLIAEAAHGIRGYGNDMAHGDFSVEVTEEDVTETLNLMGVVLSEVFQMEARIESLRTRVAARKSVAAEATP